MAILMYIFLALIATVSLIIGIYGIIDCIKDIIDCLRLKKEEELYYQDISMGMTLLTREQIDRLKKIGKGSMNSHSDYI